MTTKPRIFFVTSNPPMDEMGGCILFYKQLVERDDYDVFVVTDRGDFKSFKIPSIRYQVPRIIRRLKQTRFGNFFHDLVHLTAGWHIPKEIEKATRQFQPDMVMIGAETPIADLGISLSKKLRIPLIGHFMDWPTFAMAGHAWIATYASKRFQARYRACDLAFGICPEMLKQLGPHPNAHVFYPSGKFPARIPSARVRKNDEPYHLLFAGNLGQWYGQMVLKLAQAVVGQRNLKFSIAGKNANWTPEEEAWLRHNEIFVGFKKGAEYEKLFESVDCLLLCMGFGKEAELIESTSFKSKFVDYLVSGKPIIVWGPEYCTAVRHARKHGFAECSTNPDPSSVLEVADRLLRDPARREQLITKALNFFKEHIDCEIVFSNALSEKKKLLLKSKDLF
jgi:hypothetical protein